MYVIFGKNTTSDISKLSQITYNNFEISLVVFMPNITTNHAITYTNPRYIVSNLYLPRVSPGGAFICVPRWVLLIERRSYHGGSISGWQQNQRWRQRQGEQQKNKMFILTNNNFARKSPYFVQFFAIVAPLRHETS